MDNYNRSYELLEPNLAELLDPKLVSGGGRLHRIRATQDIPLHGVREGDLGGWVSGYHNLVDGAWVSDDSSVEGAAVASGNALVKNNSRVTGNAVATDYAVVADESEVTDFCVVRGRSQVMDSRLYGNTVVDGHAIVQGCSVDGDSFIDGFARVNSVVDVENIEVSEEAHVLSFGSEGFCGGCLVRTASGHMIFTDSWSGTVDDVKKAGKERLYVETWEKDPSALQQWAELVAMIPVFDIRVHSWAVDCR